MIRESWAQQTACAECGKETHLTGGLCHACAVAMGYAEKEDAPTTTANQ